MIPHRSPDPCAAVGWPVLAHLSREIVQLRERLYPQRVEAGRLTQAQADDGLRVARAVSKLWQAVVDHTRVETIDPRQSLGATWAEMREDCRRNAEAAVKDAAAHPDDRRRADLAEAAEALAANLAPFSDTLPRPYIVVIYEGNRDARPRNPRRDAA